MSHPAPRRRFSPTQAAGRFCALVACFSAAACQAGPSTGPLELKLAHVGDPGSLYDIATAEFARRANERLGERARVVVFGSSQLGGDEVALQKLRLGTVDIALPSTFMASAVEEFALFEMPYLVSDRAHMARIEQEVVWPRLAPAAELRGYRILAVWENGFRHITNNRRPIVVPQDLAGIKLRTPRSHWRVKLFQAYGANPTPMSFSEVFVALQTGVMDGQENPLNQIYGARLHEVQRYLSLSGHVYSPAFVLVGVERWDRLPADVRGVVEEAAREVQQFVYENAARMDSELVEELRAGGIEINQVDRARFVEASGAVYDDFGAAVEGGREMIERALASARAEGEPPRTP